MRRAALGTMLGLIVSGCGTSVTETGYEPRRLGLGDAQRRGLYAPKYSPEEAKAQAERESESKRHQPTATPLGPVPGQ